LKLEYGYNDLSLLLANSTSKNNSIISSIAFDTRRIYNGEGVLFFAFKGHFRNGHDFIKAAYDKGVRHFVVQQAGVTSNMSGANEIVVEDTLEALIDLAAHHRARFNCPVVAITGSNGKTTVKEWLTVLLGKKFNVARSPKSYNSKLGVALSLFELSEDSEIALIEVGISSHKEMTEIRELIKPTHGILTSFGSAHRELFATLEEHLQAKLELFGQMNSFIYPEHVLEKPPSNGCSVPENEFHDLLQVFPFNDQINRQNARLAIAMANLLGLEMDTINTGVKELSPLALRMESYEGKNGNSIINDTYNLDHESLRHSLEYQLANCQGKERIVLIGLSSKNKEEENRISSIIKEFSPSRLLFHYPEERHKYDFQNASILIKGNRQSRMEIVAREFKRNNHQTYLEIDLKAIRHNINYYKTLIQASTKLLCMVKASSYGSDAKTMGKFLEGMGVDYFGVAYADEGIELREKGIRTPILVMNCEERSFAQCIDFDLEPAIYSLGQLDSFIKELINRSVINYPIHVKLETGMNRLGFNENDIPGLIDLIKGQPEIIIKSVYSHLAESDIQKSDFTTHQISEFDRLSTIIEDKLSYSFLRHLLNSEGIQNYPKGQYDMVRLGIGMYGVSENKNLRPAISWISSVSQIKKVSKSSSVGYGRSFIAEKDITVAIIPVGYADGLRRSLGNGKGGVYIEECYCSIIGNVCMDMVMVDVSEANANEGDLVEIIGKHQSMQEIAQNSNTIPYEIMTGFSKRVHRVYIDQ
jgi:alanine racemase